MVALATKIIVGASVEPAINIMDKCEKIGCKVIELLNVVLKSSFDGNGNVYYFLFVKGTTIFICSACGSRLSTWC